MSKFRFLIACMLCLICVPMVSAQTEFSCADVTEIPTIECEALVAFYNSTDGNSWDVDANQGWLQTNTPCSWNGVRCSDGSVVRLERTTYFISGVVPPEISNLVNLTELYLAGNRLTMLPAEIGELTNLTTLHLSLNPFETIPSEIGNLVNLTSLSLRGVGITTTLPIEISNLTNLTHLHLAENQLTVIPPEIENLTQLTELSLYGNQLTVLPAEIGNLTQLTDLPLHGNQLTVLPVEIGNLTSLNELSLYDNQLTALPSEIGNLASIKELLLHGNPLTILPAEVLSLTRIRTLIASDGICVNADADAVQAWNDTTQTDTNVPACSNTPTSITLNSAQNQAMRSSTIVVWIALFLIGSFGTFGTYALLQKRPMW